MDTSLSEMHDALVARAIDRVLDAERSAHLRILECETQTGKLLEDARQQRRAILERARARTVSVHTQVAEAIEARDAQIQEQSRRSADESSARLTDPSRLNAAIETLSQSLTSAEA